MNWFYEASLWITLPLFIGGFVLGSCLIVVGSASGGPQDGRRARRSGIAPSPT